MVQLRTLGPIELWNGAAQLLVGRRKVLGLLGYLARRGGRAVDRGVLAELLWPSLDEQRSRQSLRQALSELKAAVPGVLTEGSVRLEPGSVADDATEFEHRIEHAELAAAVALWRGDFLEGLDDLGGEDWRTWLDAERARLRRRYVEALETLAAAAAARNQWSEAIELANRWRETDPLDTRVWTRLIDLLHRAGRDAEAADRRADALALFRREGIPPPADFERRTTEATRRPTHRLDPRSVLTPEFAGRDDVLAEILEAWSSACTGAGRVVVLEGDDGSGRSRLCREVAARVRSGRPAVVVEAAASPGERDRAGALGRHILGQLIRAPGLGGTAPERLGRLASVAPELRERFPALPVAGPPSAADLIQALGCVGAECPVLLVLDDIGVADPESLALIAGLGAGVPDRTLLLVAGRGPDPGGPMFGHPARVDRIRLTPLTAAATARLLGSLGPFRPDALSTLAERLARETAGNPGAIIEQIRYLAEAGVLAIDAEGRWALGAPLGEAPLPVPAPVHARTRERLERMSPDTKLLLEAASVLGSRFDPAVLEFVTGLASGRFETAISEAVVDRFIREAVGVAPNLEFVSEPIRRAIHDAQAPSRRRDWHTRAVRALTGRAGHPSVREQLAHHRREAGRGTGLGRRAMVAAAVIGIAALLLLRPNRGFPAESQVLLVDLDNATGDSALGRALHTAATIGLQQSKHFALFPRARVREVLARMQRAGADSVLDETLGREIAEREGLTAVLILGLARVDSAFLLTGRVVEPRSGRTLGAVRSMARQPADLITAADELLGSLRRTTGESADSLQANRLPLPRVTTASIEALRAFAAGQEAMTRRQTDVALDHWNRAIGLDSSFALAAAAMAGWYFSQLDRINGERYLRLALANEHRLTNRERLNLQADAARFRGDWERSVALQRQLAEAYPEPGIWLSLGTNLMRGNRCAEALPALRRVVALDSTRTNAWVNIATCEQLLDRPEAALAAYLRAERIDSTMLRGGNLNHEVGRALVRLGRVAAAESVYRRRLELGPIVERAGAYRSLAYLALYRDRPAEAIDRLELAVNLSRDLAGDLTLIRNQTILSEALLTAGDSATARAAADSAAVRLLGSPQEPVFYFFTGTACLRTGRLDRARALLAALEQRQYSTSELDRSAGRLLRARVLLAEGRAEDAIRATLGSVYFDHEAFRLGILAEAHGRLGHADSVRAISQRLAGGFYFGWEAQHDWKRAGNPGRD